MFSSKKDMEGTAQLLIILIVIAISVYFLRDHLPPIDLDQFSALFYKTNTLLLIPIAIDLILIFIIKIIGKVLNR